MEGVSRALASAERHNEKPNLLIKSVDGSMDMVLKELGPVKGVTREGISPSADGFGSSNWVGPLTQKAELLGGEWGGSINKEPANVIWESDWREKEGARGIDAA